MVIAHYDQADVTVANYLANRTWCSALPQFAAQPDCASTATDVIRNTNAALAQMRAIRMSAPTDALPDLPRGVLNDAGAADMLEFLRTLTDPCLRDRACFGRWIPASAEAPDAHQLNAVDVNGRAL
jgi:hypothetical protein